MHQSRKRIVATLLVLCLSVISFQPVCAAESGNSLRLNMVQLNDEIMPLYNNVASATSQMSISSSGKMTINYKYTGFPSTTTKAVITTYIEKRTLGLFWTRVDIGQPNEQWVDTIYNYSYNGSRTYQLSASGTYRVTITYKIYGTGGSADTITSEIKDAY